MIIRKEGRGREGKGGRERVHVSLVGEGRGRKRVRESLADPALSVEPDVGVILKTGRL